MLIRQIVDEKLAQNAYMVGCQATGEALVIDPERDVDRYEALADREGLRVVAVAETHIHADFLSGAREFAARVPGLRVYLSGAGGDEWRYTWPADDGVDVVTLQDAATFHIGKIEVRAWHTPGHTPEHLSFLVTDHGGGATVPMALASGDFVFVNDLGRPDLLETAAGITGSMDASARQLYVSARALERLDDFVQIWPGHGAGSACGKALGAVPTSTIGYERRTSPALRKVAEGEDAFVRFILSDQPEPPLYFAAMKRLNRLGPPVLGLPPLPRQLTPADLTALVGDDETQLLDTRDDRRLFLRGHLPGSFHAPLARSFPTVVGSMLDPDLPVVLLVEEQALDEACRDLRRIGYDHLAGWAPVAVLDEVQADGVTLASIPSIDMETFERRQAQGPVQVLDVRSASEHAAGHVPGALQIAHTRLRSRLDEVPSDGPVYVHCATGVRAAASAALLARAGRDVVHVDGVFTA